MKGICSIYIVGIVILLTGCRTEPTEVFYLSKQNELRYIMVDKYVPYRTHSEYLNHTYYPSLEFYYPKVVDRSVELYPPREGTYPYGSRIY